MKNRLIILLIMIVLVVFALPSVYSASSAPSALSDCTLVTARADSIYIFAAPSNTSLTYPQGTAVLGYFLVDDLFLEDGEWLTLTLIPGVMVKTDNSSVKLPYQIAFSPPVSLNESNIGDTYNAFFEIDQISYTNAPAGTYQAVLLFRVTSHPDMSVVWQGMTTVKVFIPGEVESIPSSVPEYSSRMASSQVTTSSKPAPSSKAVSSKTSSKASSLASPAATGSEGQPGQPPYMGITLKYGIPLLVAAILLVPVIMLLTTKRSQNKNSL